MKKMDGTKGNVIWHIKSARQWLERAEQAFDAESPARGELDLILARAEVQHAQEKRTFRVALPLKLMMHAFRNQKTLGIALGAVILSVLLLPYVRTFSGQHTDMPAIHTFEPKTQIEIPAPLILTPVSPMVASSETSKAYHKVVHEEQAPVTGNSAKDLPSEQNSTFKATSATEQQATAFAEVKTPVSEAELRMLTRTADRVLKSTK